MMRARYRYQVVTRCGAGRYSNPLTWPKAIARLAQLIADLGYDDLELERVLQLERGRRYWLWRAGAWRSFGNDPRVHTPTPEDYAHWRSKASALNQEGE